MLLPGTYHHGFSGFDRGMCESDRDAIPPAFAEGHEGEFCFDGRRSPQMPRDRRGHVASEKRGRAKKAYDCRDRSRSKKSRAQIRTSNSIIVRGVKPGTHLSAVMEEFARFGSVCAVKCDDIDPTKFTIQYDKPIEAQRAKDYRHEKASPIAMKMLIVEMQGAVASGGDDFGRDGRGDDTDHGKRRACAEPSDFRKRGDRGGVNLNTVELWHVPSTWEERDVLSFCAKFGEIDSVRLHWAYFKKDCFWKAFVRFSSEDGARRCFMTMCHKSFMEDGPKTMAKLARYDSQDDGHGTIPTGNASKRSKIKRKLAPKPGEEASFVRGGGRAMPSVAMKSVSTQTECDDVKKVATLTDKEKEYEKQISILQAELDSKARLADRFEKMTKETRFLEDKVMGLNMKLANAARDARAEELKRLRLEEEVALMQTELDLNTSVAVSRFAKMNKENHYLADKVKALEKKLVIAAEKSACCKSCEVVRSSHGLGEAEKLDRSLKRSMEKSQSQRFDETMKTLRKPMKSSAVDEERVERRRRVLPNTADADVGSISRLFSSFRM